MCGHVGVAGSMAQNDLRVFNSMLLWDVVRGEDSTGVAAISRTTTNRGWDILKQPWPSYYLMEHRDYNKVASMGNAALIGHNRKATMGKVNKANAHPFGFDNIVGAHNGTIPYDDRREIPDYNDFETDSEAIFNAIDQLGAEDFIPTLRGAYALVWYDKRDHSMNFLRNNERELTFCLSESGQTLYWASEAWMIHGALLRNQIKYGKVWMFQPDVLYKFRIPEKFGDKFEDAIEIKLEGRKEPVKRESRFQRDYGYGGYYGEGDYSVIGPKHIGSGSRTPVGEVGKAANESSKKEDAAPTEETEKALPFESKEGGWAEVKTVIINKGRLNQRNENRIVGFDGSELSEKVFRNCTKETCASCDEVINFEAVVNKTDKIKFINKSQFICETCADDPWAAQWYIEDMLIGGTRH